MTKRSNGTGSIEVLPSGKARITFVQRGARKRRTFASEEAAIAALEAIAGLHADGTIERPEGETYGAIFDRFLDGREIAGHHRGIDQERRCVNAHVRRAPFWGQPIASIARRDVVTWIDEMLATKAVQTVRTSAGQLRHETTRTLSRRTVANAVRLVRQGFDYAIERESITTNPARGVKVPRHVRDEDLEDAWTHLDEQELVLVFASALSERDRAAFATAIYQGPRRGELVALRWEDVYENPAEARPRVVVRRSGNGPTKSGKVRELPLLEPARVALERWRAVSGGPTRGLVFPSPDGGIYGASYDFGWRDKRERRGKAKALRVVLGVKGRAGIERDVRFHDLRHTCASHLVMGTWGTSWSLEQIRDFLGHSTVRVTERYAHLGADSLHTIARSTRGPSPTVAHETIARAAGAEELSEGSRDDGQDRDRTCDRRCVNAPGPSSNLADFGGPVGDAWAIARDVVLAATSGAEIPGELLDALAASVLDARAVVLALDLRDVEHPHRARRAIELAGIVLAHASRTLAAIESDRS